MHEGADAAKKRGFLGMNRLRGPCDEKCHGFREDDDGMMAVVRCRADEGGCIFVVYLGLSVCFQPILLLVINAAEWKQGRKKSNVSHHARNSSASHETGAGRVCGRNGIIDGDFVSTLELGMAAILSSRCRFLVDD